MHGCESLNATASSRASEGEITAVRTCERAGHMGRSCRTTYSGCRRQARGQASEFVLLTLLLRETSKEFEREPLEKHPSWSFLELVSGALVGFGRYGRKLEDFFAQLYTVRCASYACRERFQFRR